MTQTPDPTPTTASEGDGGSIASSSRVDRLKSFTNILSSTKQSPDELMVKGLPEWDLLPPATIIRRPGTGRV
jgi:hypothetical protein